MKRASRRPVVDEIRIRNMDEAVVLKLDSMAKKRGMSRSEYLRGILMNYAYSSEIKELDNRYQELFKIVLDSLEGNGQIMHEILVELKGKNL